jgi:hypothetical protein
MRCVIVHHLEGSRFFGGARLPEQLYDFDEGAGMSSPNIWLHQYACRAAVYRVNKVKRIADPWLGAFIGLAWPCILQPQYLRQYC